MDIRNDWLYYCATKLDIGTSLFKALKKKEFSAGAPEGTSYGLRT